MKAKKPLKRRKPVQFVNLGKLPWSGIGIRIPNTDLGQQNECGSTLRFKS
jgi:hypothetical protein